MQNWQKDKHGYFYIHANGTIPVQIKPHRTDGWEIETFGGQITICYGDAKLAAAIIKSNTNIILDDEDCKLLEEYRDEWNAYRLMQEMSGELDRFFIETTTKHINNHLNNVYKNLTL